MKRLILSTCLLALSFTSYAHDYAKSVTVKQAKSLRDNSRVTLTGKITGQAGDEDKYWLEDSTGRIKIDVDDDDREDKNLAVGKTVRVTGDTDRDEGHTEIEVDHIQLVSTSE
ncbi:NirD/YgiW/YdeI family stress tolerance protein [Erwinia mallotivora]|uniref:NirD/YgiW/YdeI family stress tolerance protein n=1 Tax=Erwinia mallotivora TaxID=69222 RepID=UPI0035EA3DFB